MTDPPNSKTSKHSESSVQDREWVAQALEGDQRAYKKIVQKYRGRLRYHVRRKVGGNNHQVDDLVQDAFVKAFKALNTYSSEYAFSTWLYKIATNHVIDHLRKRRLLTISLDRPIKTKDGELGMQMPDSSYRPDRHIVESQRKDILQDAIDRLPPKYKAVIVLRHQKEMSYADIAETLDLPLGTVKAHIFRARSALYRYLRGKEESLDF